MKANNYKIWILLFLLITSISTGCKTGWKMSNPFASKPKPAIDSPADLDDVELTPPPEQYTEGFSKDDKESKSQNPETETSLAQKGQYETFPSSDALKTSDVTQVAMNAPLNNPPSTTSLESNNMFPTPDSVQQSLAMNQGTNPQLPNDPNNFNSMNNQGSTYQPSSNGMGNSVPQYNYSMPNNNQFNNSYNNPNNLNNPNSYNSAPTNSYSGNMNPNSFNNNNQNPPFNQNNQGFQGNQYGQPSAVDSWNQPNQYNDPVNGSINTGTNSTVNNGAIPSTYPNNNATNNTGYNDFNNQYNSYNNTNSNGFTPGSIGGY